MDRLSAAAGAPVGPCCRGAWRRVIQWSVVTETPQPAATEPNPTPTDRVASLASADRAALLQLIRDLAVVHGRVTLSSGMEADYYVDLRRITLHAGAAPLVGRVMLDLVAGWQFEAAGGLTLGADPVAAAMLHAGAAAGRPIDAFVVRKEGKAHGLQRRIEGPDVVGRRVVAVEDTSTTGGSVLTAVQALRESGAVVAGVAVIVDRGTGARQAVEAAGLEYRFAFGLTDLEL
jgi:orotate phosphoribosyltransferase